MCTNVVLSRIIHSKAEDGKRRNSPKERLSMRTLPSDYSALELDLDSKRLVNHLDSHLDDEMVRSTQPSTSTGCPTGSTSLDSPPSRCAFSLYRSLLRRGSAQCLPAGHCTTLA